MSSSALADDARGVAWWVLVGVAVGAIAGFLVGGVGGRLAMLLLRLTSPGSVIGLTSDDGFEIGVVTTDTLSLVAGMTAFGGLNGLAYGVVRGWLPRRLRLPLWMVASGAIVGRMVVHEDGLDFTVLEPTALAIGLFVGLPAAAGALVVVLVERWADRPPFADRRLTALVGLAALCGTFALVPAAVVWAVVVVGRRSGAGRALTPIARVTAPPAVGAIAVVFAWELVGVASRLL